VVYLYHNTTSFLPSRTARCLSQSASDAATKRASPAATASASSTLSSAVGSGRPAGVECGSPFLRGASTARAGRPPRPAHERRPRKSAGSCVRVPRRGALTGRSRRVRRLRGRHLPGPATTAGRRGGRELAPRSGGAASDRAGPAPRRAPSPGPPRRPGQGVRGGQRPQEGLVGAGGGVCSRSRSGRPPHSIIPAQIARICRPFIPAAAR